jgi:tRNA threonylcarbamoyl adenosine modification protein YjeE
VTEHPSGSDQAASIDVLDRRVRFANRAATLDFARRLALDLRQGDVVLLDGDLGAGKSEIARAMIRALAGEAVEVPSPTFTLVQRYDTDYCPITHADLYRIDDPAELDELGLGEAGDLGVLIVEWPCRAGEGYFPPSALLITITDEGGERRTLQLTSPDEGWRHRLAPLINPE